MVMHFASTFDMSRVPMSHRLSIVNSFDKEQTSDEGQTYDIMQTSDIITTSIKQYRYDNIFCIMLLYCLKADNPPSPK